MSANQNVVEIDDTSWPRSLNSPCMRQHDAGPDVAPWWMRSYASILTAQNAQVIRQYTGLYRQQTSLRDFHS